MILRSTHGVFLCCTCLAAYLNKPSSAQADYRWELGASYLKGDDYQEGTIGGSYYFNDVDTSKGPLAEAAFLDKSSYVGAGYSQGEIDALTTEVTPRA